MTKKRFAVKWLLPLPDGYQDDDARSAARRFVREAEIAGGICHPNVVEVYDVTVSDTGCFMVMELLEGESLETRLKREGKLAVADACRVIVACASGVGAAHAASVIHRDLKPANIFLMQLPEAGPSRPKVLDFGISRFTAPNGSVQSTVTRAGTLIGTPMYMAPEQLRGFECDARTDVYGLGVTLYEALSGKPAYQAPTHADLVVRILTGDALTCESSSRRCRRVSPPSSCKRCITNPSSALPRCRLSPRRFSRTCLAAQRRQLSAANVHRRARARLVGRSGS